MRIIGGHYRSRALKAGKDQRVRPTSDKVKGALFNMLEPLEGCRVLDLYAGTGNLGLEALSRGASQVTFVDKHPESLKLVRGNIAALGLPERDPRLVLLLEDVLSACHRIHGRGERFDIVLADPPYETGVLRRVQEILKAAPLLAPDGILAIEHGVKDVDILGDFPWPLVRQRHYGDTALTLFKNG